MAKQEFFIPGTGWDTEGAEPTAGRPHSAQTSALLGEIIGKYHEEGLVMYTMEDFQRDYAKKYFPRLTPEERREVIQSLPPEEQQEVSDALPLERRLKGLSAEQLREYLDKLTAKPRKQGRKK